MESVCWQAAALPLQSNEARKAEKRTVDKAITLHVNQISATEEQVRQSSPPLLCSDDLMYSEDHFFVNVGFKEFHIIAFIPRKKC